MFLYIYYLTILYILYRLGSTLYHIYSYKRLYINKLPLPHKEVHEEDYAEEEHGQATTNLGDDGEIVQVRTRDGFIRGSLQRGENINTLSNLPYGTDNGAMAGKYKIP